MVLTLQQDSIQWFVGDTGAKMWQQYTKIGFNCALKFHHQQTARRLMSHKVLPLKLIDDLKTIVGEKFVATSDAACEQHSHDESYHRYKSPLAVVWPNSVQELSSVAKLCSQHQICMIPFGTGTGLEGGVAVLKDSLCINLSNMNQVVQCNLEDFDVKVQPGVTRKKLNYELRSTGLWFPVDPGADASLCGMAATSASGTNAVRYGTMKENVLNLEVVLANGDILNTGGQNRRCRKSSAGYNLTELFVGSEGTLGFITEATLRLHAMPECTLSATCTFPSVLDAVSTATQVLQSGIPIARIELLDEVSIQAVNQFSKLNKTVKPTLFLEFHGSESGTKEQVALTSEIAEGNQGSNFEWAETQEEQNHLWKARHDILYAVLSLQPGTKPYSTDVCVPLSTLPQAVAYAQSVIKETGLFAGILGHVGDGNFHCILPIDIDNPEEIAKVQKVSSRIAEHALKLGGTCTGEHGIGIGKRKLLTKEIGPVGLDVMKSVKKSIDPLNLMNPGKVFE